MSVTEITQNGMIERVARAIYEGRNGAGCRAWGSQPKAHREPYLKDAGAAIQAMQPEFMRCYDLGRDDANKAADVAFELIKGAL